MPRLGIASVAPHNLGGAAGSLVELHSGGRVALAIDPQSALQIVDEAIRAVMIERAKLGVYEQEVLQPPARHRRAMVPGGRFRTETHTLRRLYDRPALGAHERRDLFFRAIGA